MIRTTHWVLGVLIANMALHADIVWNGKKVQSWPSAALPDISQPSGRALTKLNANRQGMGIFPSPKDTIKGLTLIIDFSDQVATVSKADVDNWLNQPGFNQDGCNGSVRDYYRSASNGKVELYNKVYGFYRAKKPKSYYEGGSGYERAGELLKEVLDYYDPTINFADFDNDGDGYTESISIVYAGSGAVWGQGIWPHSGWVGEDRDGVTLNRYMMTDMPGTFSLYVFVHESGHMIFGWPDLYWFGDYCVMGNRMDDQNPVMINDFFRADQGWIPFADVDNSTNGTFRSLVNDTAYRFVNPSNDKEGFFWYHVSNNGRNTALAGSGIVLFHYNLAESGNSSADHLQIRIVQADNKADLQASQWPVPGSAKNDLFHASTQSDFSAATSNFSKWYSGSPSLLRIWDISAVQTEMTFKMGTGVNPVCTQTITPFYRINDDPWTKGSIVTLPLGGTLGLNPEPNVATDWHWSGPNDFSATTREVLLADVQQEQEGAYIVHWTDDLCDLSDTITVKVQEPTRSLSENASTLSPEGSIVDFDLMGRVKRQNRLQ